MIKIMLYIPKINEYLEILTDEEVKDFVAKNFSAFISQKNLSKVAKLLYIFLTMSDEKESNYSDDFVHYYVQILKLFDPKLQLISTKPVIKNKLKELLSELKKFKVQTILVLGCKKRNDCKTCHSCTKPIANDSDIDEALKSMHQSIMTKIKNYANKDWIVLDAIIKHRIKIFESQHKEKKWE